MRKELLSILEHPQLFVQQRKEWVEIVVDFETRNKYAILDAAKNQIGFIAERSGRFLDVLKRMFLRSHRPFVVEVLDQAGTRILHLSRSFFWFFSDLEVTSEEGERYGSLHRRFGILHKIYDLRDEHGQVFGRIESPIWRLWTFPVVGTRAAISKKWGGALREVFTDADTYLIDYADQDWTPAQRAVILAAAVSIDFDFFENNQGSRGIFDLFDPS
jgi:hypothetical protein